MYKIYIDSSKRKEKLVQLLTDDKGKGTVVDFISGDIDIVSSIETILKKNDLTPSNISSYNSNPGPGSFTGLKSGATIANILNWAITGTELKDLTYPEYGSEPNIQAPKLPSKPSE